MPNCRKCLKVKSTRQFYRRSDSENYYSLCRECARANQSQRRKELPDYERARYLRKYGLTIQQYKAMVKAQNNQCAMCAATQKRALSVDHHHASGKVRDLLCGSCNALLGLARENIEILKAAIAYLIRHGEVAKEI